MSSKNNWNSLHAKILSEVFISLKSEGLRFFVLRNYDGLPELNTSKDVDIIIEPGFFSSAKQLFIRILNEHNISNYYQMDFERAHCCFGIDVDKEFAIHLDFIEGFANKGFEFYSFEFLYSNTIDYKYFKVLNNSCEACMLLLYKLFGCKDLKPKYCERIFNVVKTEESQFKEILSQGIGDSLSLQIVNLIKFNDFENLIKSIDGLRNKSRLYVFKLQPFKTIRGIFSFSAEKIINIIICPTNKQHLIAVEAPDGTGKTTFINQLREKISYYFVADIEKTSIYHFRPSLLPNLGAVGEKAGVMKQDKNFTVPHRAKPVGKIASLVRFLYYWIDYVIGVPLIVRKGAQFDHFSIFDRYIYDFLVDPERSRINLNKSVRLYFARIVKQPKIVFVLQAEADIVYQRKKELPFEEIRRQMKEYVSLNSLFDNIYLLDASKNPDQLSLDAVRVVIDRFTQKTSIL